MPNTLLLRLLSLAAFGFGLTAGFGVQIAVANNVNAANHVPPFIGYVDTLIPCSSVSSLPPRSTLVTVPNEYGVTTLVEWKRAPRGRLLWVYIESNERLARCIPTESGGPLLHDTVVLSDLRVDRAGFHGKLWMPGLSEAGDVRVPWASVTCGDHRKIVRTFARPGVFGSSLRRFSAGTYVVFGERLSADCARRAKVVARVEDGRRYYLSNAAPLMADPSAFGGTRSPD